MKNTYIKTPKYVPYEQIINNNFILSSFQHKSLQIKNRNLTPLKNLLSRTLQRKDLGIEVGSDNYIDKSPYYFMRTKALQSHSYLPNINKETSIPIRPSSFTKQNLVKGDIILSKDSNIGEVVILEKDYPNYMLSGALYKLPITENKLYLLAFIKHRFFREQLDYMVPKGATIRHAKKIFLDCKIPFPNKSCKETIACVETLMQAIITKEALIKEKYHLIIQEIENELLKNQKNKEFSFQYPQISEISKAGRLDSNIFNRDFKEKEFIIKNYVHGFQSIYDFGFKLSRGQNLQISNIGMSIYSDIKHENFYTLILPKFLSLYGTVDKTNYLGNPNELKTLNKGDLIFGAEGFEKGRSIVITDDKINTITNIHGITLQQNKIDIQKAVFVKCFLDYLRYKGLIDLYAVGGNGGSLAQKYWEYIPIPKFDKITQKNLSVLYHNPLIYVEHKFDDLSAFVRNESVYNGSAGIIQLDYSKKMLQEQLDGIIEAVINDEEANTSLVGYQ